MEANQSHEFTGDDIESAIANGLSELGVGPSDVLVEVLEEPSRGVFGIGAKPARVQLKLLRPIEPKPEVEETASVADIDYDDAEEDMPATITTSIDLEDVDEDGKLGKQVLEELLGHMGIEAEVTVGRSESTRPEEESPWVLQINGKDMNLLIGRRGDTLNSLQYITRLIASRHLQRRANIIVDAGSYKSKRSDRLKSLAERMADQAVEQERTISLEPMPPYERRIIHLTLRGREDVETRSTGEGSSRKVTIVPKS